MLTLAAATSTLHLFWLAVVAAAVCASGKLWARSAQIHLDGNRVYVGMWRRKAGS